MRQYETIKGMNEEQLNDLKQFVDTTVGQSEARLKDFIKETVSASETRLTQRMDDGFGGAGQAVVVTQDDLDKLDRRVTKLEQQTA